MSKQDLKKSAVDGGAAEYITVYVGKQLFGIPVKTVQDVFEVQAITPVPLSPTEVTGVLNLRGRIVTAIDMRTRLQMPRDKSEKPRMAVGIEVAGEAYGLVIDGVGEVLSLSAQDMERNPANLDPRWQQVSSGVCQLEGTLLVILDVARVLDFQSSAEAA